MWDELDGRSLLNNRTVSCHDPEEEVLEMIWLMEEENIEPTFERIMERNIHDAADMKILERLVEQGDLSREGDAFRYTERESYGGTGWPSACSSMSSAYGTRASRRPPASSSTCCHPRSPIIYARCSGTPEPARTASRSHRDPAASVPRRASKRLS